MQSKGLSRVFSNTTVQKHQFFQHSAFFTVQLSHPYMTTGKTIALTRQTFVGKVISLLFNMLVITFLSRSKHLLISWLQSPSSVILKLPHAQGQGQQPRGTSPSPRGSGRVGAGGLRGATTRSRSGGAVSEEIPVIQGKEQWLRFAGAAVKRYPTTKVRETQVGW